MRPACCPTHLISSNRAIAMCLPTTSWSSSLWVAAQRSVHRARVDVRGAAVGCARGRTAEAIQENWRSASLLPAGCKAAGRSSAGATRGTGALLCPCCARCPAAAAAASLFGRRGQLRSFGLDLTSAEVTKALQEKEQAKELKVTNGSSDLHRCDPGRRIRTARRRKRTFRRRMSPLRELLTLSLFLLCLLCPVRPPRCAQCISVAVPRHCHRRLPRRSLPLAPLRCTPAAVARSS